MNRPFGAVDVSANLKGAVPKTATQKILLALADKGDVKQCQSTGLYIGKERYVVIKADDRSLYGKKVSRKS